MLIDTHCHLHFENYAADIDAVLARAKAAGVERMITIATQLSQTDSLLAFAQQHEPIFCTLGSHPHEAETDTNWEIAELVAAAQADKVVGLGESGLDFYYDNSPRAAQSENFLRHIEAARQADLPLVIHSRNCDKEMGEIIASETRKAPFKALLHCFTASYELARIALDAGLFISISGIVTFKNAQGLRDTVRRLPLERLLVETDAPFLAPTPHRGKRNEPGFVTHTAQALAELFGCDYEDMARITTQNAERLFFS